MYVTKLQQLLDKGDRKRTLDQFTQFQSRSLNSDFPQPTYSSEEGASYYDDSNGSKVHFPATVETKKDLKLLVKASQRLIDTDYYGIQAQKQTKIAKTRSNKQNLKFPLYTDKEIGFDSDLFKEEQHVIDCVSKFKFLNKKIIFQSGDEDYETDKDVLKATIKTCKGDVLHTLRATDDVDFNFEDKLRNNQNQLNYRL